MTDSHRPPLLVFDCDPGCDDALAITVLARSGAYKRMDLLTIAGNVSVDQTTANACRMAALLDIADSTTVFRGCSRSLMGDIPSAASVHGRDGLGDAPNNLLSPALEAIKPSPDKSAVARLVELATKTHEATTFDLLCTGPVTNLATALNLMDQQQQLAFWERCNRFVVMGGCFRPEGNITHSAEFNTFFDPVALQMVLDFIEELRKIPESKTPDVFFVPLDATETLAVPLSNRHEKAGNAARFMFYALQQYGEFHAFHCKRPADSLGSRVLTFDKDAYVGSQVAGSSGVSKLNKFCYLHDPLAAWVLLHWGEACGFQQKADIRIDAGRGESRGRIIRCEPKQGDQGPFTPMRLGTLVKWLDLKKEGQEHQATKFRGTLVDKVTELLCL